MTGPWATPADTLLDAGVHRAAAARADVIVEAVHFIHLQQTAAPDDDGLARSRERMNAALDAYRAALDAMALDWRKGPPPY